MISVIVGFLYANLVDWGTHILLHKPRGKSRFKFHWKHHKISRKNGNVDPDYKSKLIHNETWITLIGILFHLPFFLISIPFTATVVSYALIYMILHRKSHEHVDYFRKWMPWHYDHHMGKNQNANWCVVCPLMDYIMGTRIKYNHEDKIKGR